MPVVSIKKVSYNQVLMPTRGPLKLIIKANVSYERNLLAFTAHSRKHQIFTHFSKNVFFHGRSNDMLYYLNTGLAHAHVSRHGSTTINQLDEVMNT